MRATFQARRRNIRRRNFRGEHGRVGHHLPDQITDTTWLGNARYTIPTRGSFAGGDRDPLYRTLKLAGASPGARRARLIGRSPEATRLLISNKTTDQPIRGRARLAHRGKIIEQDAGRLDARPPPRRRKCSVRRMGA
jgi:hypothetical protein